MVVSYQVKFIFLFTFLYMAFVPTFSFAETAQLMTDNELDAITGAALPNNFTDSLTSQIEKTLNNSLDSLGSILNSGLLSSKLTEVNATNSTVVVQTNIIFSLESSGDIHQSNTASISN
jgi:hypothetical protein